MSDGLTAANLKETRETRGTARGDRRRRARRRGTSSPFTARNNASVAFSSRLHAAVMANPQRFLGNSLLQWSNVATAAASIPWHVEFMFRTRQAGATLLHVSSGLQHNLTLQVRVAPR